MRNKHSMVSEPNSFSSSSGSRYKEFFSSRLNDDGTISLIPSGRVDVQAEIDSHLAETDIAIIISKLQRGDTSVLNSKRAMYGDFTSLPTSFAEAYDLVMRSENAFDSLSPDIKERFDNDRAKWFASIGTPDWFSAMGLTPDPVVPSSSESDVVE